VAGQPAHEKASFFPKTGIFYAKPGFCCFSMLLLHREDVFLQTVSAAADAVGHFGEGEHHTGVVPGVVARVVKR
jgi:hypothetical protein